MSSKCSTSSVRFSFNAGYGGTLESMFSDETTLFRVSTTLTLLENHILIGKLCTPIHRVSRLRIGERPSDMKV